MSRRVLWQILVASTVLAGCGPSRRGLDTRTFTLRYLNVYEAERILGPYVDSTRPGAPGAMNATAGVLSVRETPDNLDRIGRVLAQYDRPQPMVRLTFHLIRADGAAPTDPSISDVAATLRSLFRFQGYALVAQGVVSAGANSRTVQTLEGAGGPYRVSAVLESVAGSGDSAIVSLRTELEGRGLDFQTDVGIPVGKTAVLGNVGGGTPNSALILTVRPELVAN